MFHRYSSDVTLLFEQWIIFKNLVYSFVLEYMNLYLLLFQAYKCAMHILGLSGTEPLLTFLKSTMTFKTSILPLDYGDHITIFHN